MTNGQEAQAPPAGFHYRGLFRTASIPPCKLSLEDLQRLRAELKGSADVAVERHIATITKPAEQSEEVFDAALRDLRALAGPVVRILGARGEQATGVTEDVFNNLPDRVTQIAFESATALESYNVRPINRFSLTLDFSEPPKVGEYNAVGERTPNNSKLDVAGDDTAWVNGVYETAMSFFRDRKRKRNWGWIHSRYTYNLLQILLAGPAGMWLAYRFDGWLVEHWQTAHIIVRSAIFLYVVLLGLWIYQTLIGSLRWAFPVVELEGSRSGITRTTVGGIVTALLVSLGYDVLKTLVLGGS